MLNVLLSGGIKRRSPYLLCRFLAVAAAAGYSADAQSAITTVPVGFKSGAILVNPTTNKVYVSGGTGLTVIDGTTNGVFSIANASASAVNSLTNKIYGAGGLYSGVPSSPYVTVTDGTTNAVTTIKGISGPIAVNPVTNRTYVGNLYGSTVSVLDGASNILATVSVGSNPNAIAVNPVTNRVYVACESSSVITVIDGTSNSTTSVNLGSAALPWAVAVNSATNKVYVTDSNGVTVIDGATNATTTIAVGPNSAAVAVNEATDKIYVDVEGTDSVAVIDGATNLVTSVHVGTEPGAFSINEATNQVFLPIWGSKLVAVIDGATNAVNTVSAGCHPASVAVNPVTNRIYVTDDSDNVTVIDGSTIHASPGIMVQPRSQTVSAGASVVFAVSVNSTLTPAYQWLLNGAALSDGQGIRGSATATLLLSGAAVVGGTYSCIATTDAGSASTDGASLTVVNTNTPGRLINLSARAFAGTGANALIAGYVIEGSAPLPVLIRSSGPSLALLNVAGVLEDPQLQLFSGGVLIDSDAGWGGSAEVSSASNAVGAFAWTNLESKDSALLENRNPGAFTAVTSGAEGDSGVALAEVYDATPSGTWRPSSSSLVDISARATVGTGSNVLIAGFVIGGSTAKTVLVRASGPALIPLGVTGYLSDPSLQLYSSSTLIASNAGWAGDTSIAAAAEEVGAFAWSTPSSDDSAILVTLSPGTYSAVVSGLDGDTGISLVEVYGIP